MGALECGAVDIASGSLVMYSESDVVRNPALRRKWDTLFLLDMAPPPLPSCPEDAWVNFVHNGHLRYALPQESFVRDDVRDLFRVNPERFRNLTVHIPRNCKFFVHPLFVLSSWIDSAILT
jgi:hypothetical protein